MRRFASHLRVLICILAATLAQAQPAMVEGTTFGANHQPLAGATVILIANRSTREVNHLQTISNASGHFSFAGVEPGTYSVMAMHDGYADYDSLIDDMETAWAAAGPWKRPEPLTVAPGKNVAASRSNSPR